jgi:hypothetical protein
VTRSRARLIAGGAAGVLLAGALGLGIEHTVHQAQRARTAIVAADAHPRIGNRANLLGTQRERFLDFVRATVPEHDPVRIVLPVRTGAGRRGESCSPGTSGPLYWLVVYALVPRASVCGMNTTWTVYVGIDPPARTGTVYRFAPGYAVVRS